MTDRTSPTRIELQARIFKNLEFQRGELEIEIAATPSGLKRNLLTEANIHLLEATTKLAEAMATRSDESDSGRRRRTFT